MGNGFSVKSYLLSTDDTVNGAPYPENLFASNFEAGAFSTDTDLTSGYARAILLSDEFDPKLHLYNTTNPSFFTKVGEDDDSFGDLDAQYDFFATAGATYDAIVESPDYNGGSFYFEVQVDDAGNTTTSAFNFGTLSGPTSFSDFVGVSDADDYYAFTLSTAKTVSLTLGGLGNDVDIELLDSSGFLIANSIELGTDPELIEEALTAGTYYVHVYTLGDAVSALSSDDAASNYILGLAPAGSSSNQAPTALNLNKAEILENQVVGTVVGDLSTVDPDAGDTHTYSLVAGAGDSDNAAFTIDGNKLKAKQPLDFEAKNAYSIRLKTDDGNGGTLEKTFTIKVTDVAESQKPTDLSLSNFSVAENQPANTVVGNLSTTDPDVGDTHTYTLVAGTGSTDNAAFTIEGNVLKTKQAFDYETRSAYSIRVQTKDKGGSIFEKQLTIGIANVNEPVVGDTSNNILNGDDQDNQIDGKEGDDQLSGFSGNDSIVGGPGNDILLGGDNNDTLRGEDGNDLLNGGFGTDTMVGGTGNDRFVFGGSVFSKSSFGIDVISDFAHGEDKIVLSRAAFTKLTKKSFASVKNLGEAKRSEALITYISRTGALFYNKNGARSDFGTGGKFADLTDGLVLAKSDFVLLS